MRTPEQRMFLNVITQAIHDAAYKGSDRYYEYHKDQAVAWLTSNSQDFRVICRLADLDPDYTFLKLSKAIKSDIQQLRRNYYKKQKPERDDRPGRYRLNFND
tara:strand:- start:1581 stop:1886 length:306 start_codon:yes stop_codon:yes gene_type:complete